MNQNIKKESSQINLDQNSSSGFIELLDDNSDEWNEWNEEEEENLICVACPKSFKKINEIFNHIEKEHFFNFKDFVLISSPDKSERMYNHIKLINYLRIKGETKQIIIETDDWKNEKYLKPVLENDSLLYLDIEDQNDQRNDQSYIEDNHEIGKISEGVTKSLDDLNIEDLKNMLLEFKNEILDYKERLARAHNQISSLQRLNRVMLEGMNFILILILTFIQRRSQKN